MVALASAQQSFTTLLLRLQSPSADTPSVYPVEVTLDGANTFSAEIALQVEKFHALESNPWEYGKQLGQAVFADPALQRALAFARRNAHVSVSLQLDAPSVRDLLWERLVFASGADELWFATSESFTLSRLIPSESRPLPPGEGAFKLLLVVSSPTELDEAREGAKLLSLDVPAEIRSLRDAWDPLVKRGLLQVSILARLPEPLAIELRTAGYRVFAKAATLDALADQMSSVDSLHLISHGIFKDGRASLLLENPEGGGTIVPEQDFLAKLGDRSLRLIFLQACQSATRQPGQPNVLSGLAPKLSARSAGVIAMQDIVRMQDARRFAQEFYDTLLSTGFASRAVNAGRRALSSPGSRGWEIPALYLGPKAEPIWQPDAVLTGVQDLAEQFKQKPDLEAPFPIEVIRQWPGVSSKMETSPPGPRTRVLEAVNAALFPESGSRSPIVVIAGNYGRAKTAQLYALYVHIASRVSEDGRLPLFVQVSDFQPTDDAPDVSVAQAISRTYKKCDIELPVHLVRHRLKQPVVLCVDSDHDADSRSRVAAFEALQLLTDSAPGASAIVTLDEQVIDQIPALATHEQGGEVPVLLVQLLSASAVAQYLSGRGEKYQPLLAAIQRANLFDLGGVPWLLAHLMRQPQRSGLSRSGVIQRVVNGNLAAANLPPGIRRMIHELLGNIAWTLQTRQAVHLDGMHLYEHMERVRGRREVSLEQLKSHALDTKILTPSDEDGVRFSYPGFQAHWCAQHLLDSVNGLTAHLNDITATLGRRSRARLWEDTLVLLAGLMPSPERLISRLLAGSSMSHGEYAFLAARCIHEATLAGRRIPEDVVTQVLDSLIWRSTPMKESHAAVRVRATECLALLHHPATIPHLISLAIERVRPAFKGRPTFELSGLRHAALQALLTMQEQAEEYVNTHVPAESASRYAALHQLIDAWRRGDSAALQELFTTTKVDGLPAVVAFALGTIGGDQNLRFLTEQIATPKAALDTQWSIVDSLLLFDPTEVTRHAVARMRSLPELHSQAAYLIGKLRVAAPDSDERQFLAGLLHSPSVSSRGVALKALAQLGESKYREDCELMAGGQWDTVAGRQALTVPEKAGDRIALAIYAIESLRLIGEKGSLNALRNARDWRPEGSAGDRDTSHLVQLSYEVSEDIYWRVTGGLEGDFFEPLDRGPAST